jgi:hypothetical protein
VQLTSEDANSHSVAQDTLSLFCSVNAENSEPLAARCPIPMNQVHNHRYYLLPFYFNIILPSVLTSSNLSLPFRFYDPNFICNFYHPILATWSVHLAPTPVLDQSSPCIQQCRLRSQVQRLHDLHRPTTARTYNYHPIGKPRDRWMQGACVWSIRLIPCTYFPLRTRRTYDMVVQMARRCKPTSESTLFEAEHNQQESLFWSLFVRWRTNN